MDYVLVFKEYREVAVVPDRDRGLANGGVFQCRFAIELEYLPLSHATSGSVIHDNDRGLITIFELEYVSICGAGERQGDDSGA
jgi:hypothetical protein